jgi:predicted nucleic acid-binding protein
VSLVLDSSVALAWIYAEETTDAVSQIFESVAEDGAHAPAFWRLEVANSLTAAVRRGRIDVAFRNAALADLALLDITTDPHTDAYGWTTTLQLADRFRLTLYAAAYLELAHRSSLPLASLDEELRTAGRALGVPVFGTAA